MIKLPDKSNLKDEDLLWLTVPESSLSWWGRLGYRNMRWLVRHFASAVREQGEMDSGTQLTVSFLFSPGPQLTGTCIP